MRRIFEQICILLLLLSVKGAEELIFLADDNYKVIGSPKIEAFVVNPLVADNKSTVTIALANNGMVEEILPINNSVSYDATQELVEEMHSADAINVVASLINDENDKVSNDTRSISFLPSGSVEYINFNISMAALSKGWQEFLLELDYEHQMDVGVFNGEISPLYQQDEIFLPFRILIENAEDSLRVLGVKSEFNPWGDGQIFASIENEGPSLIKTCTARVIAAPPFSSTNNTKALGNISPGEIVVARFPLKLEAKANPSEYELPLYLIHQNGTVVLSIPLTIEKSNNPPLNYWFMLIAFVALAFVLIGFIARSKKSSLRRSLRRGRVW